MGKQSCIIYCSCGAGIISSHKKDSLKQALKNIAVDVFELHDLCAFSLEEKNYLKSIEDNYDKKFIIACYPRAVKNIFAQNKIQLSNFEVLNFRIMETESIKSHLISKFKNAEGDSNYEIKKSSLKVPAWYPVIEESRCTLCGQCAHFCLFGVYKFDKKNLQVVNPLNCKNNCPACGRTCPASAIIFPRLKENSVLSGADPNNVTEAKSEQNESLFVLLNERNRNRKNIFKPGIVKQAEEERNKAIEELKKGFGKIQ